MEWGTSYFDVRDPDHARKDLERFRESGLTSVLHTFPERDFQYHRGTVEELVRISHELDLNVRLNPWGVGRVFGGEALSEFIGREADARQVRSDGKPLPAACPNAPSFRDFMRQWTDAALASDPDAVFWDEPHWYLPESEENPPSEDTWWCQCEHCQARYRDHYGEPMPEVETESVREFKQRSLRDFLRPLVQEVHRNGGRNVVCLLPNTLEAWSDDEVRDLGPVDVLASTPFWEFHNQEPEPFVRSVTQNLLAHAEGIDADVHVWLQGFGLEDSPGTYRDLTIALETARDLDPEGVFLWGWDACRTLDAIAPENPGRVWETFLNVIDHGA